MPEAIRPFTPQLRLSSQRSTQLPHGPVPDFFRSHSRRSLPATGRGWDGSIPLSAYMERDLELLSTSHLQQLLQDQGVCTDSNFLQGPGMRKKLLSFAATLAAIKPQGAGRGGEGGGGGVGREGRWGERGGGQGGGRRGGGQGGGGGGGGGRASDKGGWVNLRHSALFGPHDLQPRGGRQLLESPCKGASGDHLRRLCWPRTVTPQPQRPVFFSPRYTPTHAPHMTPRPPTSRRRPSTARPAQNRVFITGKGASMNFGGGGTCDSRITRPVTAGSRMETGARPESAPPPPSRVPPPGSDSSLTRHERGARPESARSLASVWHILGLCRHIIGLF
jgi:hypothetical protein